MSFQIKCLRCHSLISDIKERDNCIFRECRRCGAQLKLWEFTEKITEKSKEKESKDEPKE